MASKLNTLAKDFRNNPTENNFNRVYMEVAIEWEKKFPVIAKDLGVDELDLRAAYDDVLIKCLKEFKDNFEHLLNSSLRNRRMDLSRRKSTIRKYEQYIDNSQDEESNAATLDYLMFKDDKLKNDIEMDSMIKQDQRQLINFFLSKIKDPITTAIVNEVLEDRTLGKLNLTAISNKLNVHPYTVTRKLRQLKKYYDSTVFGDYRDYLCG